MQLPEYKNAQKWENWFKKDKLPPWDTDGRPCFALKELVESYPDFKKNFPRCIDLGCGSGSNAAWLKSQGLDAVGFDNSSYGI
jgi:SAM-dependent methyltransferase